MSAFRVTRKTFAHTLSSSQFDPKQALPPFASQPEALRCITKRGDGSEAAQVIALIDAGATSPIAAALSIECRDRPILLSAE
jgi:hypothetical protein